MDPILLQECLMSSWRLITSPGMSKLGTLYPLLTFRRLTFLPTWTRGQLSTTLWCFCLSYHRRGIFNTAPVVNLTPNVINAMFNESKVTASSFFPSFFLFIYLILLSFGVETSSTKLELSFLTRSNTSFLLTCPTLKILVRPLPQVLGHPLAT
jgi:hypothetical protein